MIEYRKGNLDGVYSRPLGIVAAITADASDASIDDYPIADVSGWLCGADMEFDATTPPDSVTAVFKTVGGITIYTASALTASGRIAIEPPVPFAGGLVMSFSGNTTNSAKFNAVPLIA